MTGKDRVRRIWAQGAVPVIVRRKRQPLRIRLPYDPGNRLFLDFGSGTRRPEWSPSKRCWLMPASRFDQLIELTLIRYGQVYLIQPYRPQEKCAPACWNASGFLCECSCLGEHHGEGRPEGKWYEVSETLAVEWGEESFSVRLLTRNMGGRYAEAS